MCKRKIYEKIDHKAVAEQINSRESVKWNRFTYMYAYFIGSTVPDGISHSFNFVHGLLFLMCILVVVPFNQFEMIFFLFFFCWFLAFWYCVHKSLFFFVNYSYCTADSFFPLQLIFMALEKNWRKYSQLPQCARRKMTFDRIFLLFFRGSKMNGWKTIQNIMIFAH